MIDLEKRRLRYQRYNQSQKGRATRLKYAHSEKGKATILAWRLSDKGIAARIRYHYSEKRQAYYHSEHYKKLAKKWRLAHPHYQRERYHRLQERFGYHGNTNEVLGLLKFKEAFVLGNYTVGDVFTADKPTRFERLKSKFRKLLSKLQRKQPVPDPWGDEEM